MSDKIEICKSLPTAQTAAGFVHSETKSTQLTARYLGTNIILISNQKPLNFPALAWNVIFLKSTFCKT